jgi:hypothetical protein
MAAVSKRKKQELHAILVLPPYPRLREAAAKAGIAPQSAYNLVLEDPAWDASWKAARAEDQAERRAVDLVKLESLLGVAVAALAASLKSDDDAVRLRAAVKILEQLLGTPRQSVDVTSGGEPFRFTIEVDRGRQDRE